MVTKFNLIYFFISVSFLLSLKKKKHKNAERKGYNAESLIVVIKS